MKKINPAFKIAQKLPLLIEGTVLRPQEASEGGEAAVNRARLARTASLQSNNGRWERYQVTLYPQLTD